MEVYIHSFISSALGGIEWSDLPQLLPPPGKELAMCVEYGDRRAFWRKEKCFFHAGK
jgi:hypothetical protein